MLTAGKPSPNLYAPKRIEREPDMCMNSIKQKANIEASAHSFRQAQFASWVAHATTGKNKRQARKIKVEKILNAVQANPSAYQIKIDDNNQIGMEYIQCENGALHVTFETATKLRRVIEEYKQEANIALLEHGSNTRSTKGTTR